MDNQLVNKLNAVLPVNGHIRFHKNRLLCELSDEDYDKNLGEIIKRLHSCVDITNDEDLRDQYVWIYSTESKKSLMIRLWAPQLQKIH